MKRNILIILTLCLFASFQSCKKTPLSIGRIVTETRALPDFSEVYLNDNISLTIVRSDTCYIEITTGENIIENITSNVSDNILSLCNTNNLDWIRTYDYELSATLYYKNIQKIVSNSSGTLNSRNQFNDPDFDDYYWIEVDGGSGDIDIILNDCKKVHFLYYSGTSRVTFRGENNHYMQIDKHSYGILDARNCAVQRIDIHNRAIADCYVWASDVLNAQISHCGNIYYKGEPDRISITYGDFAKGQLIHLN